MTIGELSKVTGLSIYTIRFYEKIGILKKVKKNNSGRYEYSETDIEWIRFIRCLKATDMTLEDIKSFVELKEMGNVTIGQRMEIMRRQKQKIIDRIDEYKRFLEIIDKKMKHFNEMI